METTIDTIINYFQEATANKIPLSPSLYLEAGAKINVLKGAEYDKLFELEQQCSQMESAYLEQDMTSARAKTFVKSSPVWLAYKKQSARIKQIEDFILLSKKFASLKMEEMKNNLE